MYLRGLLLAFVATLVLAPSAMAQSTNGVMATFVDYNASPNWDLHAANVPCAALDGDMPLRWLEHYWWAAFCGAPGPRGDAACGLCVQLTNVGTGKTMTDDGRGWAAGQLEVNYQFVECDDRRLDG